MQDEDKTTATSASEETSKHRNSSTMSSRTPTPQQSNRSGSTGRTKHATNLEAALPLVTVHSSESATSSVSRRRLMRLSDKMNIVKRKGANSTLPTSPLASPTSPPFHRASSRGRVSEDRRRANQGSQTPGSSKTGDEDYFEEDDEEEESVLSEDYSQRSARVVGMISPVNSAHNLRVTDDDLEDVATAQQRKTIEQVKSFLAQPGLENVPEEDRPDDEKKDAAEPLRQSFAPPQRHQRTAGGGAAKLMMVGPQTSTEEDVPTPRASPASSAGSEKRGELQTSLDLARKQAKSQFNMPQPTRHAASADESPADLEEYRAKLALESPHLFDRTEVFHASAADAMAALQSTRDFCPGGGDAQSVYSKASYGGTLTSHPSDAMSVAVSVTSAFQMGEGEESHFESLARRDITAPLLSVRASHAVEALRHQMKDPNPTLAHLLQNIALPAEGDAPDLGATVRRKNACGALHVLTAQATNRIPLAWTTGVLPALTSVLSDSGTEGVLVMYPERRHRIEFETARNRAIACLVNLATPKANRIPMFHSPDLIHWLVAVALEGHGAARKGACAVLAYLAKTPDNRLLMVQVPRLVEALTKVLKLRPPRVECAPSPRKATSDSTHDSDDDDDTMTDRSEMTGSTGELRSEATRSHAPPGVTTTQSALTEPSKFLSMSSSYSHQSGTTPRRDGGKSPISLEGYDETADQLLREARQFAFAALSNLAKEKDNAYHFARNTPLVRVMAEIAGFHDSPSHEHAVKFLACLTRHRLNTKPLVFRRRTVVPALVNATSSPSDLARLYACYALQNLSQDKSCRQELAIADNLLTSLCERSRGATDQEGERLAALSSLKNLTDEPANLIPMSNTTDCIATLMHLAHGRQEGVTPLMQFRACDALATLSHWLRKIASSGQALTDAKLGASKKELFVPTLRVVTVNQWQ